MASLVINSRMSVSLFFDMGSMINEGLQGVNICCCFDSAKPFPLRKLKFIVPRVLKPMSGMLIYESGRLHSGTSSGGWHRGVLGRPWVQLSVCSSPGVEMR